MIARLIALALLLPSTLLPGDLPRVELVADLLEGFSMARTADCLEAAVRRPATAGGLRQSALFEHPATPERAARVQYALTLPPVEPGELLLLAFDVALSDGIKGGRGEDGVRFAVEVEGARRFVLDWKEMRWTPGTVDLTAFAGRSLALTLVTEALANTAYDWALWGNPRVLRFAGGSPGAAFRSPPALGAVAVDPAGGRPGRLRLRLGQERQVLLEWAWGAGRPNAAQGWSVFDFELPRGGDFTLEWEPADALAADRVRLGTYRAQPRLVRVCSGRAVAIAGEPLSLRAEVRNEGRGILPPGEAQVEMRAGPDTLARQTLPRLAPGETASVAWRWTPPRRTQVWPLEARLASDSAAAAHRTASNSVRTARRSPDRIPLGGAWNLDVHNAGSEDVFAEIVSNGEGARPLAVLAPLAAVTLDGPTGPVEWRVPLRIASRSSGRSVSGGRSLAATGVRDPLGRLWDVRLRLDPVPGRPLIRLNHEWTPREAVSVRRFLGPNLYVGEGTIGEAKSWGLFPGLEYLVGAERSSNPRDFAPPMNDRRSPDPWKITLPLMALTVGPASPAPPATPGRFFSPDALKDLRSDPVPAVGSGARPETTLALLWDPLQTWDGRRALPSARFASPNFDEGMENHRLGLFLPSVTESVPENGDLATQAIQVRRGQTVALASTLLLTDGPVLSAVREWLRDVGGVPLPNPWPRSFQEELDLCRAGFLKTVWEPTRARWRHCIDWEPSHAPGFAALLWVDAQIAESPEARRQSRERVELAAQGMLQDGGPGLLTSQAGCHIEQWEFPFHYGYLPEAIASLDNQLRQLLSSQRPDGGWIYEPANAEQADLGQAGDSVLGTCANRAATLLRYARITGDPDALAAGEKALRFMERFRVPRGGQTWECPMYEPDILAAGYAVKAYVDGYRVTGNPRWLHDAVYWAETGVPFIYLWSLPDKPMMLGATIPVFGSTFYTHSWLGVPVQWCGLVYAYHVLHLAEALERTPLEKTDSPLPLALDFAPADWRRIVELITVSGMYQQFADGERVGAYPDSLSRFEQRNPAFLNPEDILVNVLALKGHDPDIRTIRVKGGQGTVTLSSGARLGDAKIANDALEFTLQSYPGEPSHTLVVGFKPVSVVANGKPLAEAAAPVRRDPGWWWDEAHQRLYLVVAHPGPESVKVEISAK